MPGPAAGKVNDAPTLVILMGALQKYKTHKKWRTYLLAALTQPGVLRTNAIAQERLQCREG